MSERKVPRSSAASGHTPTKSTKAGRVRKVMLDSIEYESENQARVKLNDDTVAEYADAMERKERLPPIVCYHDGSTYWLADGFHRYHAARKRGEKDTEAQVIKGSRDDARWHAAGANTQHGLKRSPEDKRKAVRLALALRPNLSDRKIAMHCGVSDKTVAALRAKASAEIPQIDTPRVATRNGVEYEIRTAGINANRRDSFRKEATQSHAEPSDPWHDSDEGDEPAAAPAKRAGAPARRQADDAPRDQRGRAIPADIREDFADCTEEVRGWLRDLDAIAKPLLDETAPRRYPQAAWSEIAAAMNRIRSAVRYEALPYAVCPYCSGMGCKVCKDRGWIPRSTWQSVPPELAGTEG